MTIPAAMPLSPVWPVTLDQRPTVVQMGIGVHGVRRAAAEGDGSFRERFRLDGMWSLHAYGYAAELSVGGRALAITPGAVGVVPPGEPTAYRFVGRSEHVYVHFTLPPTGGGGGGGGDVALPALTPPGDGPDPARFAADLREALLWSSALPRRAEARVWDLLWRLATPAPEGATAAAPALHPAVRIALGLIESRLSEGVRVAEIAREAGVSPDHLTRLFRAATGRSVMEALMARRIERARHLLLHSDLPIKAVAAQVGMEDLNLFNKTLRRHGGMFPRALREAHRAAAPSDRDARR